MKTNNDDETERFIEPKNVENSVIVMIKENGNENENEIADNKSIITKDKYMNLIYTSMPFTKYHFYLILSIFLIRTVEGTEVISLSLASSMIEKNFNLHENSSAYINVIIFTGNFIGCVFSMIVDDKYPRKFLIYCGVFLIIFFGFLSILSKSLIMFVIFRNFVNIGIGILLASSTALVTESININYRGFILNMILVSSSIGEFFISSCLGAVVDLNNPHDWRKLFLLSLTPIIAGALLMPLYPDSIYYYIDAKRYDDARSAIKTYSNGFNESEEQFTEIMNNNNNIEVSVDSKMNGSKSEGSKSSVSDYNHIVIFVFSFLNSYLVQGIKYILPKTLTILFKEKNEDPNKLNIDLVISSISCGITSFGTGLLIETSYFQRLRLMKIMIIVSCFLSYSAFYVVHLLDIFAIILRSSLGMQDQILEIYSAESFETRNRVLYLSIFNIVQSVSAFISPYINDIITHHWYRLNYLVFGVVLSILIFLGFLLKKEKYKLIIT